MRQSAQGRSQGFCVSARRFQTIPKPDRAPQNRERSATSLATISRPRLETETPVSIVGYR